MKFAWLFIITTTYCCFWSNSATTPRNSRIFGFSDQYQSQNTLGEYTFGYNEDHTTGGSFRRETSDRHGKKIGSYGLRVADGRLRLVNYIADHNGFRAHVVSNEPGLESQNSNKYSKITRKSIQRIIIPGTQYSPKVPHLTFEINPESNNHQMESKRISMSSDNISHKSRNPLEAEQSSRSGTSVIPESNHYREEVNPRSKLDGSISRESVHYPEEAEQSSASYINIRQESNNSLLESHGPNAISDENIRIESNSNPVENEQSSRSYITYQENSKISQVKEDKIFENIHLINKNESQRSLNSGGLVPQLMVGAREPNKENPYSNEADGLHLDSNERFSSNLQEKEMNDGSMNQALFSKSEDSIRNYKEMFHVHQAENMSKRFGERIYHPIINSPANTALKNI